MPDRPPKTFRPALERLEEKRPLSAGGAAAHLAAHAGKARAAAGAVSAAGEDPIPRTGYLLYRITNPNRFNNKLVPPFAGHVLIGGLVPEAGKTYNVLQITVRNGTAQTFTAANSNLLVRYPGAPRAIPILTGDQEWRPGERFVFYVLSHKYYPLPSQVHSGFEFSLDGARSIGIPGPSGIILRVKYNPATFLRTLDRFIAYGPGNQGGVGARFGLPNTSIYEFVSAKTDRNDFSGYF